MVVPRDVVYEKFRVPSIVKSYSRIPDVEPLPHLVQIQVDSYEVFKKEGLRELFDEISPISDFTGNRLEMRFTDYRFGEPKYDQDECRERDATFAAPLRVNVAAAGQGDRRDQGAGDLHGRFPAHDRKGHVHHQRRRARRRLPARPLSRRLPDAGAGRHERPRPLLRQAHPEPRRLAGVRDLEQGRRSPSRSTASARSRSQRCCALSTSRSCCRSTPARRRSRSSRSRSTDAKTEREADKLRSQLLQLLGTNDRILALFEDVDTHENHRYIKSTLDRDPSSENKEEALLEFYRRLRPGDPPTIENAKQLINSLFFNPRRYDLGKVGRYKVNKRLGRASSDHNERVLITG